MGDSREEPGLDPANRAGLESGPCSPPAKGWHTTEETASQPGVLPYAYLNGQDSLTKAWDHFKGPIGLLAGAAQALGESVRYHARESSPQSSDDENRQLAAFARKFGLMMDIAVIHEFMEKTALRGGSEHKVALSESTGRVLKDLDTRRINSESIYDYLTDLELSNYYFEDDIHLEGFYEDGDRIHIVTSQPYRDGPHPDLPALKAGLEAQEFRSESPTGSTGTFSLYDDVAGQIYIHDVKPDKVVLEESTEIVQPIDVHFYFDNHARREKVLQDLGIHGSNALRGD